jgi:spermidine/putrescine ABC transporter ATP-binding subunit
VSGVNLSRITKLFGANRAVDEVSIEIASGEFVTLLGPSGCGKTTTLRAIAGLVELDSGRVEIGGQDVTRTPVDRRNIGMVFQSHALFPHMTVAQNVAFGLRMRGVARGEQQARIRSALGLVHLADFGARYPHQLSGGQQQRVALARALVISPSVLLLDEPFGALDRKLRESMQVELRQLTRELGMTAVFVTHDQQEALVMSDRIAVMNGGRIEQLGTPAEVFDRPATRFVADFMGVANLLDCTVLGVEPGGVRVAAGALSFAVATELPLRAGQTCTVAIRAERLSLSERPDPRATIARQGTVEQAIYGGTSTSYRVRLDDATGATLSVIESNPRAIAAGPRLQPGTRAWVSWEREAAHVLGASAA